jgi:hypothetical protein
MLLRQLRQIMGSGFEKLPRPIASGDDEPGLEVAAMLG